MKKKITLFLSAVSFMTLLATGCGDAPLTNAVDFIPNRAPAISDFTCSLPEGTTYLTPGMVIDISLTAADPEGGIIKIEFTSDRGSFSNQYTTDDTTTVDFIVNDLILGGEKVYVSATLTDPEGVQTVQRLEIGSGKLGPTISEYAVSNPHLTDNDTRTFQWQADSNGFYQISIDPVGPVSFDRSKAAFFYDQGEIKTITVEGKNVNGGGEELVSEGEHTVHVLFVDGLMQEESFTKTFYVDNTAPTGTIAFIKTRTNNSSETATITASDTYTPAESIEMQVSMNSDFSGAEWVTCPTDGNHPVSINGVDEDKIYYVRFRDLAGNFSTAAVDSATITYDTTGPGPVTATGADVFSKRVELTWTNPGETDFQSVRIVRRPGTTPPVTPGSGTLLYTGTGTSFTDTSGLDNGTTYAYAIFSYDDLGNYESATFTATPVNHTPTTPQNLSYTATYDTITFQWDASSDLDENLEKYRLYISSDDASFTPLTDITANPSPQVDVSIIDIHKNLGKSASYYFRVTAIDLESAESNPTDSTKVIVSQVQPVGAYSSDSIITDIKVNNNRAYITGLSGTRSLIVLDISDITSPTLYRYSEETNGIALAVTNSYIFQTKFKTLSVNNTGLAAVSVYEKNFQTAGNIIAPLVAPVELDNYDRPWSTLVFNDTRIIVGARNGVWACEYQKDPPVLEVPEKILSISDLNIRDMADVTLESIQYLLLASYGSENSGNYENDGLAIYKKTSPVLQEVTHYRDDDSYGADIRFGGDAVAAVNEMIYLAVRTSSEPTTQHIYTLQFKAGEGEIVPEHKTIYDNCTADANMPLDLCIAGNYLFMAAGSDGLRVVNITNPIAPEKVTTIPNISAYRVTADSTYLYVAAGDQGLLIYELNKITTIVNNQ